MSMGAVPYPIVPPLPQHEEQTTIHGAEQRLLVPEQQANIGEQRALEEERVNATEEQRIQAEKVARAEALLAAEQAKEQQRQIDTRARVEAKADQDIGVWKERVSQAYNDAISAPQPSLWANKTTGEKVMRAIAMVTMAVVDAGQNRIAVQQGRAPSSSTLHDFIESDLAQQRAAIQRLSDRHVMAKAGLKDAQEARELELAKVDARGAAIYKRVETLARARMAALKFDQAAIDQHQAILEIGEKGVEYRQRAVGGLYKKIEGDTRQITNRAPTEAKGGGVEADKNAANYELLKEHGTWLAGNMAKLTPEEIQTVNAAIKQQNAAGKYPVLDAVAATLGIDAEKGASPRAKEYLDRLSRFKDGMSRVKSGASMTDSEAARIEGWALPKPSDRAESIGTRSKNLLKDIDLVGSYLARPARAPAPTGAPGAAPAPAGAAPTAAPPRRAAPVVPGAPEDVNSEAPLPEDPRAATIDQLQPGAAPAPAARATPAPPAPAAPAPAGPQSLRDRVIQYLRANPGSRRPEILKKWGITEAELGNP
jgi:hypothetical protein